MTAADVNLHVWLETIPQTQPAITIPYVRSSEDTELQYTLDAIRRGRSGSSNIRQSGSLSVQADRPAALSRFSISAEGGDECRIKLTLTADGRAAGTYQFNCPRAN